MVYCAQIEHKERAMPTSKGKMRRTAIMTTGWLHAVLAILLGLGIAGCITQNQFSDTASSPITIPMIYEDSMGTPLPVDQRPADATVLLGAIPGEFAGHTETTLITQPVDSSPAFELKLGELRKIAA